MPVRHPQGTVTWSHYRTDWYGPPCATVHYLIQNKSDTPVLEVTVAGVRFAKDNPDPSKPRLLHGAAFPAQTQAAGIPPWGEKYVSFRFCRNDWPKDPLFYDHNEALEYLEYMDIGDWEAKLSWRWAS